MKSEFNKNVPLAMPNPEDKDESTIYELLENSSKKRLSEKEEEFLKWHNNIKNQGKWLATIFLGSDNETRIDTHFTKIKISDLQKEDLKNLKAVSDLFDEMLVAVEQALCYKSKQKTSEYVLEILSEAERIKNALSGNEISAYLKNMLTIINFTCSSLQKFSNK